MPIVAKDFADTRQALVTGRGGIRMQSLSGIEFLCQHGRGGKCRRILLTVTVNPARVGSIR